MRILISNDDGYQAPGIISLAQALAVKEETVRRDISFVGDLGRPGAGAVVNLDDPAALWSSRRSAGFQGIPRSGCQPADPSGLW